ncbi:MAG: glutamate mutase L, partial [Chloroflexota bacterium]|nr:glutamate mutase L [Chloroflexota bacterium]
MPTSVVDTTALLAIDIGTASTRALLFDVVNGCYRFLTSGSSPTTAGAPFFDVGEGVRRALEEIESAIGRRLIGNDENLIMPSMTDNSGVDILVATMSAGKPLKIVAVGLLEDVTLASARRLAATTYSQVADVINLNDRRQTSDRINAIMHAHPDLVIVAGGTDNGASKSVLDLIEAIGLASYLTPKTQTPHILFVGNKELQKEVHSALGRGGKLHTAPNIRPTLGIEDFSPAQQELSAIYKNIRSLQIGGINELLNWSGNNLIPTATAFGRIIRFLSKKYDPDKGVLGVDIGSQTTTVTAAFNGKETLKVFPYLGVGIGSLGTLKK